MPQVQCFLRQQAHHPVFSPELSKAVATSTRAQAISPEVAAGSVWPSQACSLPVQFWPRQLREQVLRHPSTNNSRQKQRLYQTYRRHFQAGSAHRYLLRIARRLGSRGPSQGKQSHALSSVSPLVSGAVKAPLEKALSMLEGLWWFSSKDSEAVITVWWSAQIFVIWLEMEMMGLNL